ncbi:hypothetical protein CDL15_Pgr004009 [Punica granatum]|uniref:Uncharacterized protein n=1 Tax=Punica granatum TaxID=22663 RepID=A0A218XFQ0_PUNGR|nr:hypothetical protein CDL15_Pgr004009 [Punica granatum]
MLLFIGSLINVVGMSNIDSRLSTPEPGATERFQHTLSGDTEKWVGSAFNAILPLELVVANVMNLCLIISKVRDSWRYCLAATRKNRASCHRLLISLGLDATPEVRSGCRDVSDSLGGTLPGDPEFDFISTRMVENLKFSHGDEVKLTASALVALGDMAIQAVVDWFAPLVLCQLEGWTFHFLAEVASVGAIFITLLVPIIGHQQTVEEERDLLQGHRFWKYHRSRDHSFPSTFDIEGHHDHEESTCPEIISSPSTFDLEDHHTHGEITGPVIIPSPSTFDIEGHHNHEKISLLSGLSDGRPRTRAPRDLQRTLLVLSIIVLVGLLFAIDVSVAGTVVSSNELLEWFSSIIFTNKKLAAHTNFCKY